jgi:hypothetical protein
VQPDAYLEDNNVRRAFATAQRRDDDVATRLEEAAEEMLQHVRSKGLLASWAEDGEDAAGQVTLRRSLIRQATVSGLALHDLGDKRLP